MTARFLVLTGVALLALTGFAGTAAANTSAFPFHTVKLRAGPGHDYPVIGSVKAHEIVYVRGCTDDWRWCDVTFAGRYGWVAGDTLNVFYHHHNYYIPEAGPRVGIPFVVFDIDTYWDTYYRNQPFYREYYAHHPHHHHDHDWDHDHHDHGDHHDHDGDHHDHDSDHHDWSGDSDHHHGDDIHWNR